MSSKRRKNKKNNASHSDKSASERVSSQKVTTEAEETEVEVVSSVPVIDEDTHTKYSATVGDSRISVYAPLAYDMSK